jgi:cell division protein FtsL
VFWALTAVIVTSIVVALVSVSALVVETGFGVDRTEARIAQLREDGERLRRDVAEMSAPGRIAHWAQRKGLVMPETPVVVLQVPGGADDAGEAAGEDAG